MKTFILGVTGRTGMRTARVLIGRGDAVTGLYRRPGQLDVLAREGVAGVPGDIAATHEQALAQALHGSDLVIYAAGSGDQDGDAATDAIDGAGVVKAIAACRLAGVGRFILVSVFPEAQRGGRVSAGFEHYVAVKKRADMALAETELDWIILRPGTLTGQPGTGHVRLGPAVVYGEIARDDVAATIASLAHAPGVRRRILEVTAGPVPLADAVAGLGP